MITRPEDAVINFVFLCFFVCISIHNVSQYFTIKSLFTRFDLNALILVMPDKVRMCSYLPEILFQCWKTTPTRLSHLWLALCGHMTRHRLLYGQVFTNISRIPWVIFKIKWFFFDPNWTRLTVVVSNTEAGTKRLNGWFVNIFENAKEAREQKHSICFQRRRLKRRSVWRHKVKNATYEARLFLI